MFDVKPLSLHRHPQLLACQHQSDRVNNPVIFLLSNGRIIGTSLSETYDQIRLIKYHLKY